MSYTKCIPIYVIWYISITLVFPQPPIFNLLAVLTVLLLQSITNWTAADHSTIPALVSAAVFSHLDHFWSIPTRIPTSIFLFTCRIQHKFQHLARFGLCPPHQLPTLPVSILLLCFGHSGLAVPLICPIYSCCRTFAQAIFAIWNTLYTDGFLAHSSILFRSEKLFQQPHLK